MTDEITPQPELTPITPPIQDAVIVPEKKKVRQNRGALENLPQELKDEMEEVMRSKNPGKAWEYMREKYGPQNLPVTTVTKAAFYEYSKKHNIKLKKELALQNKIATTSPELLKVIDNITDTNISLGDKRAALTALYKDCEATSKMLQERQTNFLDPQIEALILANRKQMCTIIEKVAVLNDQLTKESDKDWLEEAEILVQVILAAVVTSYKMEHPDQSLYLPFMSRVTDNFTNLMKSYKATKENLIKEKTKP